MRTLPGKELNEVDYEDLMKAVDTLLWDIVYKPIVDAVRPSMPRSLKKSISPKTLKDSTAKELHNVGEEEALRKALKEGAVQIVLAKAPEKVFFAVAKPNRKISDGLRSFGAKLNKTTGLWESTPAQVPSWVRFESSQYTDKARSTHDEVKKIIDDISSKVDELIDRASITDATSKSVTRTVGTVQGKDWKKGAKKFEASWNLGPEGQIALDKAFERSRGIQIKSQGTKVSMVDAVDFSTKREVKVWAAEALARLRAEVEVNAEQGYRAEGLADRIRNEYGVSKSRASLIARQETSNFMANYIEASSRDAGIKKYQWYAVKDSKTRPDHRALHGKIFSFDNPPITDTQTGARNNPSQDFRCRCRALPVIP